MSVAGDPGPRRQSDRMNFFCNASFDGGEVTLWVIFDRSSQFCPLVYVRLALETDVRPGQNRVQSLLGLAITP